MKLVCIPGFHKRGIKSFQSMPTTFPLLSIKLLFIEKYGQVISYGNII